jgi:hypothetical protein
MTDDELRAAFAAMVQRRGAGAACPPPEALLAIVERDGPEAARLRTLDHAAQCADCRADLDLLRATHAAAGDAMPGGVQARTLPFRRRVPGGLRGLAAAASVVIALGLAIGVHRGAGGGPREEEATRGEPGRIASTGPAVVAVGSPAVLRWERVAGAGRYRVEVLDRGDDVAFATLTTDSTATIPAGRLAAGRYRWWVHDASGSANGARSALRPLEVR